MKKYFFIKRLIDIIFSMVLLIVASPFFLIIALLIKIYSPQGPVFYGHRRIGKNGRHFKCWKFRTMVPNADVILEEYLSANPAMQEEYDQFFKLKKDPRIISKIGTFLRNSSFDELPQFFNVLKGEMSVVGPRPIVDAEIKKYGIYYDKLISVKPGITGLWQISGRNDVSYEQRVALDMQYIDTLSLREDLIVGFCTIRVMILGKGY